MTPRQRKISAIADNLLKWFTENARELPWRRTREPYAIWVSEIMLQQTQVKTVIPYWERWMRALPDIADLAAATPETIHKLWEGLGYYTRVRNLQKAAQQIMAEYGGRFPRDHAAILNLPGIGRYTAGAISSIAFNEPQPILDGNVVRVLTRLFGIAENAREKAAQKKLWGLAGDLVLRAEGLGVEQGCSRLNQSLMELGATVCTPKQPKCPLCPVRRQCDAHRAGRVDSLPNLGPRTAATARRFMAFVIESRGRFLTRQRPAGVVNAHLWEFPNAEVFNDGAPGKIAEAELGFATGGLEPFCTVKHSITRYRITLEVYRGKVKGPSGKSAAGQWLGTGKLNELAFASAHRKVVERLGRKNLRRSSDAPLRVIA